MRTELPDLAWCTSEQREALRKLHRQWNHNTEVIGKEVCGDALLVRCKYNDGNSIVVGIERDGYAHS